MTRTVIFLAAFLCAVGAALAAQDEDISIRGNFPQLLARGETTVQMANRIAILVAPLDRMIAPPCGMKRYLDFGGADYVDIADVSRRLDPRSGANGVWRIVIIAKGCWTPRTHNVFVFDRVTQPASLRLGVPGGSSAGVKHQQDAMQIVLREANSVAARTSCEDRAFMVDTAVTVKRVPGKAWNELWTTSACEIQRKWAVTFTPEGEKMRIMVVPT